MSPEHPARAAIEMYYAIRFDSSDSFMKADAMFHLIYTSHVWNTMTTKINMLS